MSAKTSTTTHEQNTASSWIVKKLQNKARELEASYDVLVTLPQGTWEDLRSLRIVYEESFLDLRLLENFPNLRELFLNGPRRRQQLGRFDGPNPKVACEKALAKLVAGRSKTRVHPENTGPDGPHRQRDLSGIEKCPRLKTLGIYGEFKLESLAGLENCRELRSADLHYLNFSISVLSFLPNLKKLTISCSPTIGNLLAGNPWQEYPRLSTLVIESCPGLDRRLLMGLKATNLKITGCGLKNLDCIDMSSVVKLDVSRNEISDIRGIETAPKIENLNIAYNRILDLEPLRMLLEARRRVSVKSISCYRGKDRLLQHLTSGLRCDSDSSASEEEDDYTSDDEEDFNIGSHHKYPRSSDEEELTARDDGFRLRLVNDMSLA